jgi:hypothetical protein
MCADRVAKSRASRSRGSDLLPVGSAAIARPVDRASVCEVRPPGSSPDDPLGIQSSVPPSASETSASTPNGVAEVPLTPIALDAFRSQISLAGPGDYLFPNAKNASGYQKSLKRVWRTTLQKAGIPYFRIYHLRSTYATRLSAGGVADEWVTQLLRQGDSQVFKKYSQMKLAMKREAMEKLNRLANEMTVGEAQSVPAGGGFGTVLEQFGPKSEGMDFGIGGNALESE